MAHSNRAGVPQRCTPSTIMVEGHAFGLIAPISVGRDSDGRPVEDMPQSRYAKREETPLHRYGGGPFCRLAVAGLPSERGVYAVVVGGDVKCVGKCDDLAEPWGPRGYARVHPRNCYRGGQQTNCRINHLVLLSAKQGANAYLWFHTCSDPGAVEAAILRRSCPEWNLER